jgi:hypothetical protein
MKQGMWKFYDEKKAKKPGPMVTLKGLLAKAETSIESLSREENQKLHEFLEIKHRGGLSV